MANKIELFILFYLVNSISCVFKVFFDTGKFQCVKICLKFSSYLVFLANLPSDVVLMPDRSLILNISESNITGFPVYVQLKTQILGQSLDIKLLQQQKYLLATSLGSSVLIKNSDDSDITESISDNLVKYQISSELLKYIIFNFPNKAIQIVCY
jgi:hypothetical protein